ncbi:MAG: hypothetical protein AAF721_32600, partial [Myxococcota bacterium]
MSVWTTATEQWHSWIEEVHAAGSPIDGALDDLDGKLIDAFRAAAFPGQTWETRVEDPGVANRGGEPFDSMATAIRPAPAAGGLEVGLEAPGGLSVSLEDTLPDEKIPTLVKPAVDPGLDPALAETDPDAELFIPTLTRPAAPAEPAEAPEAPAAAAAEAKTVVTPAPVPVADAAGEPRGDRHPPSRASGELGGSAQVGGELGGDPSASQSGMISVDDDVEAAQTITRGEIIREDVPDPIIPKGKIVIDPSASGVIPAVEEDDPEELDAADVEQLDDTAPPPGSAVTPPPPAPVDALGVGDAVGDGPPPAPGKTLISTTAPRADVPPP